MHPNFVVIDIGDELAYELICRYANFSAIAARAWLQICRQRRGGELKLSTGDSIIFDHQFQHVKSIT